MKKLFELTLLTHVEGKRVPVVAQYIVLARDSDEAKEVFDEEYPGHIDPRTHVSVVECAGPVRRIK